MSRTELYTIRRRDGRLQSCGDANNAWRGAMIIWHSLEEKYLPSLPLQESDKMMGNTYRSRFSPFTPKEEKDRFWRLERDPRLTWQERIVLATTYDFAVIFYEDLPEVADAYEQVEFATENMKKQAEIMREVYGDGKRKDIGGVYKLETSVCCLGDLATQKRSGYCYINENFYNVMGYLRDMKSVNYDWDAYKRLKENV